MYSLRGVGEVQPLRKHRAQVCWSAGEYANHEPPLVTQPLRLCVRNARETGGATRDSARTEVETRPQGGVVRGSGQAVRLLGPQLPGASPTGKGRRVWNDHNIVTEFGQHGRCDVAGVTAAQVEPIPQEHRTKDVNHATDTP